MRKRKYRFKRKLSTENNKGVLLVTTLSLIATVATLSVAYLTANLVQIRAAENFEHRTVAFHWAEGAIDQTLAALRSNPSYTGVPSTSKSNGRVSGSYSTTVTSPSANVYQIVATGSINGTSMVLPQSRGISVYANLAPQSPFKAGLISNQTISMSGNAQTDAYDSSLGSYGSQTPTNEGHVLTNRSGGNSITLSGNVRIRGDATVGPGANVSQAIVTSGNAAITGTKSAASATTTLAPVTVPANATSLGAISISGNASQTLTSGTYAVPSISISGNGKLNITGSATVYVTGNISISGNGIGTAQNLPTNLKIYVQGARTISLTGNANFYGAIYAPNSSLSISGNGAVYGALVANTLADSGNGSIHFDKALQGTSGGGPSNSQVTYWTEL